MLVLFYVFYCLMIMWMREMKDINIWNWAGDVDGLVVGDDFFFLLLFFSSVSTFLLFS